MTKPLPCPFCGAEPLVNYVCDQVLVSCPTVHLDPDQSCGASHFGIDRWNTRAAIPPVPDMAAEIAALRAEVARLTAERDAAEPVAWQWCYVDEAGECGAWWSGRAPKNMTGGVLERALYAHPAPDTLRQVREAAGRAEYARGLRDAAAIAGNKALSSKEARDAILAMIPEGE